jgi:predicted transcriptional regulator
MARKRSATLTEAEYPIMDVLWTKGPSSVAEVVAGLPDTPAYNTILTLLRILEQKGYVRHKESGRAFIYRAVVEREDAQREAVDHMVSRFFNNKPSDLVLNLLESEKLDDAELLRLRKLIDSARSSEGKSIE